MLLYLQIQLEIYCNKLQKYITLNPIHVNGFVMHAQCTDKNTIMRLMVRLSFNTKEYEVLNIKKAVCSK